MAHFYESSIITTKDGLHCQVYGNEHPFDQILVKPKYIPTGKVECDALQYRFIFGRKMNRLNLWIGQEKLKKYLKKFQENYPQYIFSSEIHDKERFFFAVPINQIERIYFPRKGLSELMSMPESSLDQHLRNVYELVIFLLKSGLRLKDLGVTYSTLMGHYSPNVSDINIVVYGKKNFWQLMRFLETAEHPLLKWKTKEDWLRFYFQRNRFSIFDKEKFLQKMEKKKSEGFFNSCLFVLFPTEKEEETWFKWGEEKYKTLREAVIEGTVNDNFSSVVRPGFYGVEKVKILESTIPFNHDQLDIKKLDIKKVVFYCRDYCQLAVPGEKIKASGILEEVTPLRGKRYHRIAVGYFDSYLTGRKDKEYINVI